MRHQRGFAYDKLAHRAQIADGGVMAEFGEHPPRGAVAQLRLVAEGEQRLGAAGRFAAPRQLENLFRPQKGLRDRAGRFREGAIVTDIPAKLGERNEDLLGVADDAAILGVALHCRGRHQLAKRSTCDPIHLWAAGIDHGWPLSVMPPPKLAGWPGMLPGILSFDRPRHHE